MSTNVSAPSGLRFDSPMREVHPEQMEEGHPEREEVQENCKNCPKPRDWSEWVIAPTALLSLALGVFEAASHASDPQDNGELFAVSFFVVSGALGLSWVRVRTLWVKKSLYEETRSFEGENRTLTDKITKLERLLEQRSGVIDKLKGDIEQLRQGDDQLTGQADRLARETIDLQRAVDKVPEQREKLAADASKLVDKVDEVSKDIDSKEEQGESSLDRLDRITARLDSLERERKDEEQRHQQAKYGSIN